MQLTTVPTYNRYRDVIRKKKQSHESQREMKKALCPHSPSPPALVHTKSPNKSQFKNQSHHTQPCIKTIPCENLYQRASAILPPAPSSVKTTQTPYSQPPSPPQLLGSLTCTHSVRLCPGQIGRSGSPSPNSRSKEQACP